MYKECGRIMHSNPAMRGGTANTAQNYCTTYKQNTLGLDGNYKPRSMGNGYYNYDDQAPDSYKVEKALIEAKK